MKKKVLLCGIAIVSLLFNVAYPIAVNANEVTNEASIELSPRYQYIKYANSSFEIRNGVAIIKLDMASSASTTKSLITSRLQKKVNGEWTTVEAWTVSANKSNCSLEKTKSVGKGYEYRVFSTVKAYTSTGSESIAVYSQIKKY